ncbi:MAG: PhzF family phenazine biosynthesis protein [Halobacteriaceae archaeon]
MGHRFHVVDVFAERRYAGNPLAVVEETGDLGAAERGAIAREMAYSETTFVDSLEPRDGGYDVHVHTPESEVPFAGHPTLGTAAVLREVAGAGEEVTLNLPVGQVPVDVRRTDGAETLWMTQPDPEFGPERDRAATAAMLSLDESALDPAYPVQVVSTGLPTVVVPLRDRAALTAASVDRPLYDECVAGTDAENVLPFCPDPRDDANDFAVRMFAPGHGVPEDPATGSSNGCLAAYLCEHDYLDGPVTVRVEQGYAVDRPSLLFLAADRGADGVVTVEVGGRVVSVARGDLL